MIGEIRWSLAPYYNRAAGRMAYKKRPVLIIAKADADDYVVLPVSRVTASQNIDPVYDVKVDPAIYPGTGLTAVSYVRTHKQLTIHSGEIAELLGDMKSRYLDLYLEILQKREQFSQEITNQAIS